MNSSDEVSSSDEMNSNEMDSDDMPASDSEYVTGSEYEADGEYVDADEYNCSDIEADLLAPVFEGTQGLDIALRFQLDAIGRPVSHEYIEYTYSYKHYTHFPWFADVPSDTMSSAPPSNPDDGSDSRLGSDAMVTASSDSRLDSATMCVSDARHASVRYEFVSGPFDIYRDGKTVSVQCAQRVTEYVNGKLAYLGYFVDAKPAGAWYTWDSIGRATMHE